MICYPTADRSQQDMPRGYAESWRKSALRHERLHPAAGALVIVVVAESGSDEAIQSLATLDRFARDDSD